MTIVMIVCVVIVGSSERSPSIAEVTLMAGVMKPSEIRVAHPMIAGKITQLALYRLTKAYKAKIPPSPLLSALNAKYTYLIVVIVVKVQKTQDNPPKIRSSVIT